MHVPRNMVQGTPFFNDDGYIESNLSDIDLVDVAADEGRDLNVWTISTWYQARELVRAGVDGSSLTTPACSPFRTDGGSRFRCVSSKSLKAPRRWAYEATQALERTQ